MPIAGCKVIIINRFFINISENIIMKNIQKFLLPLLIGVIILFFYFQYFAPSDELGSFSSFDPNNNASKPIIVKFVADKGLVRGADGGTTFYVMDKDNKVVKVSGPANLPPGMDAAGSLVLTGHLSGESFHAHGVELRN